MANHISDSSDGTTRRIYFSPAGRIHSSQWSILLNPPDGYEFVVSRGPNQRVASRILSSEAISWSIHKGLLARLIPVHLVVARLKSQFVSIPHSVRLVYTYNHLFFKPIPWVVHAEWVHLLAGFGLHNFRRFRHRIENSLRSTQCKGVITWSEAARNSLVRNMDCSDFIEKISIVPLAVSPKTFARLDHTGARFLFVGSIDRRAFEAKGGKEILEAFRVLLRRHENIKLSMRIECPISIKQQYADVLSDSRVELIDYHIAEERLARLYSSADVFLMPAHDTPFRSILEAMSYELPVLTIDKQANGELVQNGVTGYVIKPRSQQMKFYWEDYMKTGVLPRRSLYDEAVHALNPDVVEQLVELSSKLVDNPTLRMSMGRAARREIEVGRFSVANRNCILKTIFDRALSNS